MKSPETEFAQDSPERAFAVWALLIEQFGQRFIDSYGRKPGPIWQREIAKLDDAQLRHGLDRLLASGAKHPPTLPEFLECCRKVEIPNDVVEALALKLIPSFDRERASRRELADRVKANLGRARGLLDGSIRPEGRELNIVPAFRARSMVA